MPYLSKLASRLSLSSSLFAIPPFLPSVDTPFDARPYVSARSWIE